MSNLEQGFHVTSLDWNHKDTKWITDKMNNSIATHENRTFNRYSIVQVYSVNNSYLWNRYTAKRSSIAREMNDWVPEKRLFHGTTNADHIVKNGFDLRYANSDSMFGKGIYFADLSSKSNQYTFRSSDGSCDMHGGVLCTRCIRTMLVCRVALGRPYYPSAPMRGAHSPPRGYHSVMAMPKPNFLNYPEYVVYSSRQIYPGYLVEYRIN